MKASSPRQRTWAEAARIDGEARSESRRWFSAAREQGQGKGEANESGENGSSAGAVGKAKTRGKQRENRGSGGKHGSGLRLCRRERGRERLDGGEEADGWAPHVSCWRERGGGRECRRAGWAKQVESEGGMDFFFFFKLIFKAYFKLNFE